MAKVITTQNPFADSIVKIISREWERIIKHSPHLISLFGEKPYLPGAGGSHIWRNAYDIPAIISQDTYVSAGGTPEQGVITFAIGHTDELRAGDVLMLENDSVQVKINAVAGNTANVEVVSWNGSALDLTLTPPGTGIPTGQATWLVLARAISEVNYLLDGRGGFKEDPFDWNGIQIYRQHRIHTQTMMDMATHNDSSQMFTQVTDMLSIMARELNLTAIAGAERSNSRDDAGNTGRCGGVAWLASVDNSVNTATGCAKIYKAVPGPLEYADVTALLGMIAEFDQQGDQWALVCNGSIQHQISYWSHGLAQPVQVVNTEPNIYGRFHNLIRSPYTNAIIPVVVDWNMPGNQVFLINTSKASIVYRERPTLIAVRPENANDFDGSIMRVRAKMTIEWLNSFANVGVIYNVVS